jgi:hypothetical protein
VKAHADLERALTELGAFVASPPEPDLTRAVRARIEAAPKPRPGVHVHPWLWTRRSIVIAAALFVLACGIAVGSYLGVRGVRIRVVPTPTPTPSPTVSFAVGGVLGLGAPVSLEQVAGLVDFPVRVPSALGRPDEVYLSPALRGGGVWMLYRPRPGLPESKSSDAGLLLLQFEGSFTRASMGKLVGEGQLRDVTVGGEHGFWVEGAHTVGYVGASGDYIPDTLRIADNTLLWQVGTVTFRLESALSLEESIRIAESIR